jgi:outer membrane murein-binding lipoprotein Lpp
MRPALAAAAVSLLVLAGCGNFFPNADSIQLPSGIRDYKLGCGSLAQGACEARAAKLVDGFRLSHPGIRLVSLELDADGDYTATFSDGTSESMIVN